MGAAHPRFQWGRKNWWIVFIFPRYIPGEKLREPLSPPHRYGSKDNLHQMASLKLQTRLKFGVLASMRSFWVRIQVCAELWNIWGSMVQPKNICICSQQLVWSFRGERSTKIWKRRWKTQLNVTSMKVQLPSLGRWHTCQSQNELCE